MISYCTSCKGRRYQLQSTLYHNLQRLKEIDAEWIILDYHSNDNLAELLKLPWFKQLFDIEKIKMFRVTEDFPFEMPLAKNLAHRYASGDILFNLDADNFIDNSYEALSILKEDQFLWTKGLRDNGTGGRIGCHRKHFMELNGYNLDYAGAGYEDIDFAYRLQKLNLEKVECDVRILPIKNTREDTLKHTVPGMDHYEINRAKWNKDKNDPDHIRVNPEGMLHYQGRDIGDIVIRVEG